MKVLRSYLKHFQVSYVTVESDMLLVTIAVNRDIIFISVRRAETFWKHFAKFANLEF